jgi:hypothetical protein
MRPLATLLLAPLALASDGFKDTPLLPGTSWHVHDPERPKPVKVEAGKAACRSTPAPAGAKVLFDGSSLDAWKPRDGAKKPQLWTVRDGLMVAVGNDLQTKDAFGSGRYHVEWRIPADRKVKGQSGGNSGFFLLGRYEVQILESFENVTYADGQAAALYGQFPPSVNASLPKGEWQSYQIDFEAPAFAEDGKVLSPAVVTVVHNGITVHDRQAFIGQSAWRRVATYAKHPATGPVILQFHGDPIEFRNIWHLPR